MNTEAKKSKLDELAKGFRKDALVTNTYTDDNQYNATNTRALSDKETPIQGKGTGVFLDTDNGGSDIDINGNPTYPGSGRIPALANNQSKWGYSKENPYKKPLV